MPTHRSTYELRQRNQFWLNNHIESVVCAKVSKIDSQLLLAHSSSNVLSGRGSEKAFNECLGVSNVSPSASRVMLENCSVSKAAKPVSTALLSGVRDISKGLKLFEIGSTVRLSSKQKHCTFRRVCMCVNPYSTGKKRITRLAAR